MAYTTKKGITTDFIDSNLWAGIRYLAHKKFKGSGALFEACWHQYRTFLRGAIDDPKDFGDVMNWLDHIAAEKVNNPESKFYIYG